MRASDLVRGAFVEIRAHKVRSALTCLSLSIGVAAALYTLSQVAAVGREYRDVMRLSGPGRLEIEAKSGYVSRGLSQGLTFADARALRRLFPGLYMVSPLARGGADFRDGAFRTRQISISGVTPEWSRRDWVYRLRGRFLNARDVDEAARVCVLVIPGGWIKKPWWARDQKPDPFEDYAARRDLLGRWVELGGRPFRVVGVLQEPPRELDPRWFSNDGRSVLVPLSTYQAVLAQEDGTAADHVAEIIVDTGDEATIQLYSRRIAAALEDRHRGEKDYEIKDFREIMSGALQEIKSFIASIGTIGLVAILAGGIGILNVTLATVFSRVREIGVRRALGATRRDIVWQFVAEALVLGAIAGVVGSAGGAAGVLLLSPSVETQRAFSPLLALATSVIAVGVAFAFSVVPAWQASRLDPLEALRYE